MKQAVLTPAPDRAEYIEYVFKFLGFHERRAATQARDRDALQVCTARTARKLTPVDGSDPKDALVSALQPLDAWKPARFGRSATASRVQRGSSDPAQPPFTLTFSDPIKIDHTLITELQGQARPFQCRFPGCGAAFASKPAIMRHIFRHSGPNLKSRAAADGELRPFLPSVRGFTLCRSSSYNQIIGNRMEYGGTRHSLQTKCTSIDSFPAVHRA